MPKFIVVEVSTITAKSADEAVQAAKEREKKPKSVVYSAETLDTLPHPVHLQEVQDLVGYVKAEPLEVATEEDGG